jgi:hypothetical protein
MSLFQSLRSLLHRGRKLRQRSAGWSRGHAWVRPAVEPLEDRWLPAGGPSPVQDLFVIGLDNQVWAEKLDPAGNPVGGYFLVQTGAVKSFSAGHDAAGRPELFVIGLDDQVYGLHFDGNGNPVGGYFQAAIGQVKSLSAGQDALNRPELFVIGLDDQVWALHFDPTGNPVGSYFLTQVGQVEALDPGRDASNRPELFVIGLDDQVWAQKLDATGNPVGGYFLTQIGRVKSVNAGHDAGGNPDVFVTGLDDQVWAQKLDAGGNPVGGYFLTQLGLIKSLSLGYGTAGNPEVFVVGLDDQIWVQQLDASGNPLESYSLTAVGAVTALAVYSDPTVYARGLDGQIYRINTDAQGHAVRPWRLLAPGQVVTMRPPNANPPPIPLKDLPRPVEAVSPAALNFVATLGHGDPPAQSLVVQNTGTYSRLLYSTGTGTPPLDYRITVSVGWLAVQDLPAPLSAGAAHSHPVSVTVGTMPAGTYTATITITANAFNGPQVIPVTLTITTAVPVITVTPPALTVNAEQGSGTLAPQTLMVSNTGDAGSMLNYSITANASWLAVTPAAGRVAAGAPANAHQVVININGLVPATYHATITITGDGSNSPQTVPVTLTITPPAGTLAVNPAELTFTATQGCNVAAQALTVRNTGTAGSVFDYRINPSDPWLSVSGLPRQLPAGTANTHQVSVNSSLLRPGTYHATVTVTDVTTNAAKAVPVTLTVQAAANPFAGSYVGSYSGTGTAFGITAPVNGSVHFTVDASGAITVTDPASGHGTVNASGSASFAGAGGFGMSGNASYSFNGTFVLSPTGDVSASGGWSATFPGGGGSGTWRATRSGSLPCP